MKKWDNGHPFKRTVIQQDSTIHLSGLIHATQEIPPILNDSQTIFRNRTYHIRKKGRRCAQTVQGERLKAREKNLNVGMVVSSGVKVRSTQIIVIVPSQKQQFLPPEFFKDFGSNGDMGYDLKSLL
jgi:hypothetical protein